MTAQPESSCRRSDEDGLILVLSMVFMATCGLIIAALFTFTGSSFGTAAALGEARGRDFDAESSLNAAIATIRASSTEGYPGTCNAYTPTWTLNAPTRPLRVDCAVQGYDAYARHVVLSVCPASVSAPCPEASSVLRADVTYYDASGTVGVTTWSNK